jgi:hypothetical protein
LPDFKESWPVAVQDISLIGMHIVGALPVFDSSRIYFRLAGTKTCIACERISQNDEGLRVKIELAHLELQKLILESDVYASLVLEAIPDELPST